MSRETRLAHRLARASGLSNGSAENEATLALTDYLNRTMRQAIVVLARCWGGGGVARRRGLVIHPAVGWTRLT